MPEAETTPELISITVVFRTYGSGDVVALLPEEPGKPGGDLCVGIGHTVQPYPVDYDTALANTKPSTNAEAGRLQKHLEDLGYQVTSVSVATPAMHATRKSLVMGHVKFPTIRLLYGAVWPRDLPK